MKATKMTESSDFFRLHAFKAASSAPNAMRAFDASRDYSHFTLISTTHPTLKTMPSNKSHLTVDTKFDQRSIFSVYSDKPRDEHGILQKLLTNGNESTLAIESMTQYTFNGKIAEGMDATGFHQRDKTEEPSRVRRTWAELDWPERNMTDPGGTELTRAELGWSGWNWADPGKVMVVWSLIFATDVLIEVRCNFRLISFYQSSFQSH